MMEEGLAFDLEGGGESNLVIYANADFPLANPGMLFNPCFRNTFPPSRNVWATMEDPDFHTHTDGS